MPLYDRRFTKSDLFPHTAAASPEGHLLLGGCDAVELAARFGTPLYVFDEETLRHKCQEYLLEFGGRYPDIQVIYACKAFINRALALILKEEGLGLDVVSGGELAIARSVDFPMGRVYFHGNNKSSEELRQALEWGVGRIVVDNLHELALLDTLCHEAGVAQDVLLRITPGIDPHTHAHTTTGVTDSKFGLPLATGQAEEAVEAAQRAESLNLIGLHMHLGSPIFELEPYQEALKIALVFAADMRDKYGLNLLELSPGGGFAVQYQTYAPAPSTAQYAEAITTTVKEQCKVLGIPLPRLVLEPGRAIVGQAGVALYTVGAIKEIPGLRKYASVDGGMADNIRPALYGAQYEALVANKVWEEPTEQVTIAGKFCESGDILIRDLALPQVSPGDLVAVPTAGAYALAMASNYNASLKPTIVMVRDGEARLIRRRETFEDLMRLDVV